MKLTRKTSLLIFLISVSIFISSYAAARDFTYKEKGNRDPFISLVTPDGRILPGARATTESGSVELEGIIWDPGGKSVAILNGKLVKEKQRIRGMQVLRIKKASVVLQKGGKVMVIELKKGGGSTNGEK